MVFAARGIARAATPILIYLGDIMQIGLMERVYTEYPAASAGAAAYGTRAPAQASAGAAGVLPSYDTLQISGYYPGADGLKPAGGEPFGMDGFSIGRAGAASPTAAAECATCASRRYQDGSDDASVSFQTPTKLSPGAAASAVMSHEMEHVTNEQAYAARENREILYQSVVIHRDICPECGTVYVAGGETKTVSRGKAERAYGDSMKIANKAAQNA